MFLFIGESLGTSELILIGIVALILLGPRRLPEIARKVGKTLAEFRATANEFKETWKREVDLEQETKLFDLKSLDAEADEAKLTIPDTTSDVGIEKPTVRELDASEFANLQQNAKVDDSSDSRATLNDKKTWL